MGKKRTIRKVKALKSDKQWHLHRNIAQFALNLDREQNSGDMRKDKPQSAPIALLDMVF